MLEIKHSPQDPEKVVSAIFEVLAAAQKLPRKIAIGSFSPEIVEQVKKRKGGSIDFQAMGMSSKRNS